MNKIFVILIYCQLVFLLSLSAQPQSKYFQSDDIFQTAYFIENKGQFDQYAKNNLPIQYGIDHHGNHIYFNNQGWVWKLKKQETSQGKFMSELEREKEKEKHLKIEETSVSLDWIASNKECLIQHINKSKHYFTYGEEKYISYGYEKIIYNNIYPLIDIEYIIPKSGGIKYSLILHPGADINQVKFKYSGKNVKCKLLNGNLIIQNKSCNLIESGLKVYDEDGRPLKCDFKLEKDMVQFSFDEKLNSEKKIIIDPFVSPISTLTGMGGGNNKGYDIEYDYQGNLYVYGGGNFGIPENTKVAKYSNLGSLIWTFNGTIVSPAWQSLGSTGDFGNFVVEKLNSKTYIGQGFVPGAGTTIIRLDGNGVYDNFISAANPNFNEIWEMNFDCNSGNVLGMGGGTSGNINMGVINAGGGFSSANLTGIAGICQDILSSTISSSGEVFVAMASSCGTSALNNVLIKVNSTLNGNVWTQSTGFSSFAEADNKPYVGSSVSNGFNALHANNNYLYYYDGMNLAAYSKNTGLAVGGSSSISGHVLKIQGGIYADECDNVYIGGDNGNIKVFHFDGSSFSFLSDILVSGMSGKHIYDIKYSSGSSLLYVSGESFVATLPRSEICVDTASINATINFGCSSAIATILNGNLSSQYSFIWTDSTTNTVIQTHNNTGSLSDTANNLIKGHVYHVLVIRNAACGGASKLLRFVPSGEVEITTNPAICFGQSITINGNNYSSTGVYIDTIKSLLGCDTILTTNLTVNSGQPTFINKALCPGKTLIINGVVYSTPGTYTDTLISTAGCDSIIVLTIVEGDLDVSSQKQFICGGHPIIVGTHIYTIPGTYLDTLLNQLGCDSIVTTKVEMGQISEGGYFIANVFTPNNDNLNDCFGVTYWPGIEEIEFMIYNRWGQAVFKTNNLWDCWNGNFKGEKSESGVYFYYIKAKTVCGEAVYKGDLTLLR